MDVYQLNFAGLLSLCAVLFVAQRSPTQEKSKDESSSSAKKNLKKQKVTDGSEASQWPFLTVFALVMGSDWLQVSKTHLTLTYSQF